MAILANRLVGSRVFFKKASRIIKYFKPYWKQWLFLFIIVNFSTATSLVNPLIMKYLIDIVLVEKNIAFLQVIMGFFVGVAVLGVITKMYYSYYYQKLKYSVLFDVRNDLFKHLTFQDVDFYKRKKLGDILSRLTGDVSSIETFVSLIFNTLIISVITLIFVFVISASLHLRLTLISLLVVPMIVGLQFVFGRRIRGRYRIVRERGADFLSFLQERLSAVPLIKLFTQEQFELEREKIRAKDLIRVNLKLTLTSVLATAATGILISGTLLYVLWYGANQVIIGALTIGSLVAIYTYIGQLFTPIAALTKLNMAMQTTLVSADRVFEFLDTKPDIKEKADAKPIINARGKIQFKSVSFAYQKNEPVLEKMDFTIKAGESVGLVGPSGVGKTSLVQLITRFYDPLAGQVLIDGHDVKDLQIKSLRKQIGMVTQEVVLFNATLRENILYGRVGETTDDVIKAAQLAGIHDFIVSLPNGYETEVGERGLCLSQGQRQRISLARVFLKDPKIFLLDEATASLDSESELRIQEAIDTVMKGRTNIIIAHRLTTIHSVDRIFVLSGNSLVEQGSFADLMDRKGSFYEIYQMQFSSFPAVQGKRNL